MCSDFMGKPSPLRTFDHPGIVPIHEIGEYEGQHYFSMGFVDGESLAGCKLIKKRLPNVLTYFTHNITNTVREGFNRRIQSLKANARGFRTFDNYRTRILFYGGKLDLEPTDQ